MSSVWAVVAVLVILAASAWYGLGMFPNECRAHGGEHITYPYKSMPECWTTDGRRVLW